MLKLKSADDTICALATPPGHGGISVVRVSGARSLELCKKLMNLPTDIESHRAYFTTVYDLEKKPLDEVIVTYFENERSYTGETTLEISCHGSPAIAEEIINNLLQAGCRHAERGEFTFRAFMSGKIDLVQAESVLSLIESDSKKSAEASLRQLKGELSKKIIFLKEKLLHLISHLEASIDFSLEGLETISQEDALKEIRSLKNEVAELVGSYQEGKILTDCFTVALIGEPNVGKSSLFNYFVKSDKAIVTEIAGTTRDTIEGYVNIAGIKVKFVDTAGLRDAQDVVEKIGIRKAKEQIQEADLILYILDATSENNKMDPEIYEAYKNKILVLGNKTDLKNFNNNFTINFHVSAKKTETLLPVIKFLEEKLKTSFCESSAVVLKARQYEALFRAKNCLERAEKLSQEKASQEFLAFELRDTLELIMELLGEKFNDDVLQKVFQEFCIGK